MDEFELKQPEQQVQQQVQQQAQQQEQTQEQQLHMHLVELQNWDRQGNQTIEQRRREQSEQLIRLELDRNADTKRMWREKSGRIEAKRAAEGRPTQIQQPAEKTYKQRREDRRLDRRAREMTPLADHVSLHMLESLQKEQGSHANSITREITDAAEREQVDMRVLRSFAYGFEKNRNGEPLDEEQQSRKEADQEFFADYLSKDAQRRKPHLDRMLEQVLSIDITEEMFEPEYMEYHAGELHEQITRMVYFQNVYDDPLNREYFAALPQVTRDLIECKVLNRYALYGGLLTHLCALRGVTSDGARMIEGGEERAEDVRTNYTDMVEGEKQQLREMLAEGRSRERMLIQNEFERLYEREQEQLVQNGEQMKQEVEAEKMKTEKGADMSGLNLTGFVTGYSFSELAKYRKMIEDHPDNYMADRNLIDILYQQMYRSIDALGDLTLEAMASQGVLDGLSETMREKTQLKSALQKKALLRLEETDMKAEVVRRQINGMADALSGLLVHKPMSRAAKQVLMQYGYMRD